MVAECGVVCSGVVWCGVVWCGVVWCAVEWCGMEWSGVEWCGVVWSGVQWSGVVWSGVDISFVDISEVNRQVIHCNRSAGQNILQYIECTRQDKIFIAIYRMHSGGTDQTINILFYIPTHHSELEKK